MDEKKEIRETLRRMLSHPSVQQPAEPGMPFGRAVNDALMEFLSAGERLGFCTRNLDGYAGHVEWGEGPEILGILAHLDVVPAGEDWTVEPYAATFRDGNIYGRGILDDKGPAVAVLYAMKRLKDEGVVPRCRVRLIVGCNEESGWKCMDYYMAHEEAPTFGFSPDGDFPVISCEKGVLHVEATFSGGSDRIVSLTAGERVNMVPDRAEAVVIRDGTCETVRTRGVSAHGSQPEQGTNAALLLLEQLAGTDAVLDRIRALFSDPSGTGCHLACADESGALTLNLGTLRWEAGKAVVGLDIRYPIGKTETWVLSELEKTGAEDIRVTGKHNPLFVSPESDLVKTLLAAYEKVTKEPGCCLAIGGATYARAMKCGVAFGPIFPGQESTIHRADERVEEKTFFLLVDLYEEAIRQLCR